MKRFFMLNLLGLFVAMHLYSQSASDSGMYKSGMELMDKAKTTENFLEAAFYFEHLKSEFPEQWLACYYASLAYIQASRNALESKYKDQLIDKAQPLIDKAWLLQPDETEMHALQAFLYQSRLQVNPQVRGLNYSQKAEACLKKAIAADSSNPRAYFLMGCNIYYTPAMFRGGAKNALPYFLKAREKFRTYSAEYSFLPKWGGRENSEMIGLCQSSKN